MRRPIIIIILIFISINLVAEGGFIGLSNKIDKSEDSLANNVKIIDRIVIEDDISYNYPVLAKSFYIGALGDFNSVDTNRTNLLNHVNSFWISIKEGSTIVGVDPNFSFILKQVYDELLIQNYRNLKYWHLGYVNLENNRANIDFELFYREQIYVGTVYLEKNDNWLITDLQLQNQEKGFFDPSSTR